MNDSKDNPKPLPPDDFSATTPNIKIPKQNLPGYQNEPSNDWEKTNYNYSPKDLQQDDKWKKTAYNIPAASDQTPDFNKPYPPNQPGTNSPKDAEWGMTQANIQLPYDQPNQYAPSNRNQYESNQENYGSKQPEFGATTPFINLPQSEREKYEIPPPKTNQEVKEEEQKKKKGVPGWVWAIGGLLAMFIFAIVVLLGVYFLFLNRTGFDVIVKGAPPRSDVYVNGSSWGVTSDNGDIKLQGLKAGETKKIEIKNPNFICAPIDNIIGVDGQKPQEAFAQCRAATSTTGSPDPQQQQQVTQAPKECLEIKKGDYAKAAQCAYNELDKLDQLEKDGKSYTVDQLLYAMNLYIINFASGKSDITPKDMSFLQRASGYMKKLPPNTVIGIGGHTDNVGTDAKNQPLSENRAIAVKNALTQKFGIRSEMLQTKGYGSKVPRESNDTEDGRFRNRRIEYTVISK